MRTGGKDGGKSAIKPEERERERDGERGRTRDGAWCEKKNDRICGQEFFSCNDLLHK